MEYLAMYLRLSIEDEGDKDESNSISKKENRYMSTYITILNYPDMRWWSFVMMATPEPIWKDRVCRKC